MKKFLFLTIFLVTGFLFTGIASAAGEIYYSPEGSNNNLCGPTGSPCRTYDYAYARACALSDTLGGSYYIYHKKYGYSGFCDKSGGGGTEPTDPIPPEPYELGSIFWPIILAALGGFALGIYTFTIRDKPNVL